MSQYRCTCGERLSNVGSPNKIEHYLLNDYQLDEYIDHIEVDKIFDDAISVWKCPFCNRLTFFDSLGNAEQVYTLEKTIDHAKPNSIYIAHDIGKSELTKEQAKQLLIDHNNGEKLPPKMLKIVLEMVDNDPDSATVN